MTGLLSANGRGLILRVGIKGNGGLSRKLRRHKVLTRATWCDLGSTSAMLLRLYIDALLSTSGFIVVSWIPKHITKPQSKQKKMGETQSAKKKKKRLTSLWFSSLGKYVPPRTFYEQRKMIRVSSSLYVIYQIINHSGANRRMKVTGRPRWEGFTVIFRLFGALPHDRVGTLSAAADATVSFLVHTFLKVIVLANFDFFFFFFFLLQWTVRGMRHESRAKNTITQRVTLRGARPSDGELWRSSLISELPRRDKGPLKSQETEQSKSRRTFQEKQRATETQHDPGRCCV